MNVQKNILPKNQIKLTIELSPEELTPHLDRAAQELSKESTVPGFRPGKAPRQIVEQRVGAMRLLQHAAEYAVQYSFVRAITEHKLMTVGSPTIEVDKIAPDNPLVYTATVSLLPEVTLGDYHKLKSKKKPVNVEEKEIDETVHQVRRMYGKEKRVLRKAQKGDKIHIDLAIFRDKVPIDGGQAKGHPVVIGESQFIPGFEEQLIGMAENETREFTLTFPKDYHQGSLAGKPAEFRVTVKGVHEIELPPLDDSFAKTTAKLNTLAELRTQIKNNIQQEKTEHEDQRYQLAILDEVIEQSRFGDIPDLLLSRELDLMMQELKTDIERRGMKFPDYLTSIKKNEEELRQGMIPSAEKRIKSALIIREIAKRENVSVSREELDAEVKKEKTQHAGHDHDMARFDSEDFRDYVRSILINRKVLELLAKFVQI